MLEKYKKLGENWGYSDAITPLYIYENYIMERLTLDTNHDIPIFVNMKERDMRDYLYVKQALTKQEKVNELLGLYKQRDYLLSNKPKTKYQIDIWKQRLKNNQYTQECLVKELEEMK